MTPTRILHVVGVLGGGGIETFVNVCAGALGHDFVCALHALQTGTSHGAPPWPNLLPQPEVGPLRRLWALVRAIDDWQPQIVHCHDPGVALYGAFAAGLSRTRPFVISHGHGVYPRGGSRTPWGRIAARLANRRYSKVLACSAFVADILHSDPAADPDKITVLDNPVDVGAFQDATADLSFRERNCPSRTDVLGIFVGRLSVGHKGLDVICDAVRRLPRDLPLRVSLVGPGDLKMVIEHCAPPERVTIAGPVEHHQVSSMMKAADFFLHPSRTEAFGISIVEGMAAGLPVISTSVDAIPDIVVDGETGLLVPPEDPQALADAIQWMVEHPVERAQMGRRGRERAMLFDVHTIAAQLEQIYREVLDG